MRNSCKGCEADIPETVRIEKITEILDRYGNRVDALIMILQEIQSIYRYLPEEALRIVTEKLEIPFSQVYEVATFYRSFSLDPRGKHEIRVCLGTACHLRGGPRILENFERELGVKAGETTSDRAFTLETINCVGACALAPLVLVDTEYFGNNNSSSVKHILKKYTDK
jgi:NADH-quinone oxidoreductase subunit E